VERVEVEERHCEMVTFIQGKMKVLNNTQTMHVISNPSAKVRLPQLSIPNFSGHLQDWIGEYYELAKSKLLKLE
jgi:hypothetical protein